MIDLSDYGLRRLALEHAGSSYNQTLEVLRLVRDEAQDQCAAAIEREVHQKGRLAYSGPTARARSELNTIDGLGDAAILVRKVDWRP